MSDKSTPETDTELERSLRACHSYACGPDFARRLERERDDYKARLAAAVREIARLNIVNTALDESKENTELSEKIDLLRFDLRTAITEGNRSREIIYAMAAHLQPHEDEHNINAAARVTGERDTAIRERDELRAEVAEIIHDEIGENSCEVVFIKSRFTELHGQIDDLRAEVERLKADGKRLDWLDRADTQKFMFGNWVGGGGTLREAIDAAMKGELK